MKKILLFSFMLLSALVTESWAQERTISGKVTAIEDGSTMPGVNVVLKGTTNGISKVAKTAGKTLKMKKRKATRKKGKKTRKKGKKTRGKR